jgi:hypothetical protein
MLVGELEARVPEFRPRRPFAWWRRASGGGQFALQRLQIHQQP